MISPAVENLCVHCHFTHFCHASRSD